MVKSLELLALGWVLCGLFAVPATAQKRPEKNNMDLARRFQKARASGGAGV